MKHLGLFEGIGGFSLAARWMGWDTVAWCEWNPFCQKVLKHHFPNATGHGDITATDFTIYRGGIDILTGGDPCQPSSTAGKGLGTKDHRFLWPEMYRAVNEAGPSWIVNENVSGTISNRILDQKIVDLERSGYTCWPPMLIPAGAVGAQHRRDRVWLVAHSDAVRSQTFCKQLEVCIPKKSKQPKGAGAADALFGPFISGGQVEQLFTDEPPLARANNGLPKELDAVASLGNSIDPRLAFRLFQAIEQFNHA